MSQVRKPDGVQEPVLPLAEIVGEPDTRISVRLGIETESRLERLTEDRGTSMSAEIRIALAHHCHRIEATEDDSAILMRSPGRGARKTVRLTDAQHARLERHARRRETYLSDEVRTAIVRHLDRCGGANQ